jgi:hypothetical protein
MVRGGLRRVELPPTSLSLSASLARICFVELVIVMF